MPLNVGLNNQNKDERVNSHSVLNTHFPVYNIRRPPQQHRNENIRATHPLSPSRDIPINNFNLNNNIPFRYNNVNAGSSNDSDLENLIRHLVHSSAALWSRAYLDFFVDFPSFKNSFISQFWDETKQLETKLALQSARYKESEGSFVEHFMKFVAMSKHLEPNYSEQLLMKTIARHYPPNISSVLVGTHSLADAMDKLRQADYYFRFEMKINTDLGSQMRSSDPIERNKNSHNFNFRNSTRREFQKTPTKTVAQIGLDTPENFKLSQDSENDGTPHNV
ncbi:hypothetical protein HHI36_024259 [Cryptolaemus montrouzieri]|uniref:Retrotransposon gag domain-containing protein n=1 Tax=Cryptolaemus montrouzieri TaxID=559131 RepID=A0ABD2N940_9CUCU